MDGFSEAIVIIAMFRCKGVKALWSKKVQRGSNQANQTWKKILKFYHSRSEALGLSLCTQDWHLQYETDQIRYAKVLQKCGTSFLNWVEALTDRLPMFDGATAVCSTWSEAFSKYRRGICSTLSATSKQQECMQSVGFNSLFQSVHEIFLKLKISKNISE